VTDIFSLPVLLLISPHKLGITISSEKNLFYRHKKTFSAVCSKTAIAGWLFELTALLPTDIMILASEATAFAGWVMLRGSRSAGALRITSAGKQARVIDFQKEKTMKSAFVWTILGIVEGAKRTSFLRLAVLLCTLVFWLGGCSLEQPGETAAEGQRRHLRNLTLNQQNLVSDVDRTLLIDKPSTLSDKKIPPGN
jgi:hypothetical protein